jgi:hypothetical protein
MFIWKEGSKYQLRTGDLDRYAKFKVRELLPEDYDGLLREELYEFFSQKLAKEFPVMHEGSKDFIGKLYAFYTNARRMPDELIVIAGDGGDSEPYFLYHGDPWGYGSCTRVYNSKGHSIAIHGERGEYQRNCGPTEASTEEITALVRKHRDRFQPRGCSGMEPRGSCFYLPNNAREVLGKEDQL